MSVILIKQHKVEVNGLKEDDLPHDRKYRDPDFYAADEYEVVRQMEADGYEVELLPGKNPYSGALPSGPVKPRYKHDKRVIGITVHPVSCQVVDYTYAYFPYVRHKEDKSNPPYAIILNSYVVMGCPEGRDTDGANAVTYYGKNEYFQKHYKSKCRDKQDVLAALNSLVMLDDWVDKGIDPERVASFLSNTGGISRSDLAYAFGKADLQVLSTKEADKIFLN